MRSHGEVMVGDWTSLHDERPAKFVPITATASREQETKFAKDQAPDLEHLHPVKLSAIFAQVQTPVRIFLRRRLLAIVEVTRKGQIHTEAVRLKQKHKLTTRGIWRAQE
ncbi:hypothetical protein OS493_016323 [Desmophyllum pertusum]|uniref:Uncharacterized protein n=1 Tax=Desmophyllum pertusum TaxID=174260 RepID=A0A9W9ZSP6_9CNID|nr:hypothetical protein OS493_016323 [Desmophyllum pertusum]